MTLVWLFIQRYWPYIVTILVVIALLGFVYYLGGTGPRAELAQERAERQAAEDMFEMQEQLHDQIADAATEDSNKELANAKERLNRTWEPIAQGLEKEAADAGRRAASAEQRLRVDRERTSTEPVRQPAGCPDPAVGDNGLPLAVERFVEAERAREGRQLAETSRRLQVCQAYTDRLINGREWAARQRVINQPFKNP